MTATDTLPVSVASYFINMYFVGCLPSVALCVIECRCMREGREVRVMGY